MSSPKAQRYLITSALPYANGPLHFGHIAGVYLPADVVTRHLKMMDHVVIHISGSDEHGVAIMQNAQKAKIPYQDYVNNWHASHRELFKKYSIEFDFFGQTSADYHREETLDWFQRIWEKKFIEKRSEKQLQCKDCHNYLPDRFVQGKCYECGYEHARGDECPECGTWIDPLKLIDPICQFCGSQNIHTTDSHQYYLALSRYHKFYQPWLKQKKDQWKKTVYPYLLSLCEDDLHDRAITRDLDWGIDVPLPEAKGKKLYVWFDAPIGYVSNTKEYLKQIQSDQDYLKDWWNNPDCKLVNFIGKDNLIFHGIIFPVMSMIAGKVKPVDDLPANQYVNLFGKQFSKSAGWYIDADEAVERFGATALRYYLISLIPETADSSFTWSGFEAKVNNELANNIGNFINRSMKFLEKNWPEGVKGSLVKDFVASDFMKTHITQLQKAHNCLYQYEVKNAMEIIMGVGHQANLYFSDNKPWELMKKDPSQAEKVIAHSALLSYFLGVCLTPFLPELANKILELFPPDWKSPQVLKSIYQGRLETLSGLIGDRLALAKSVEALVPKIDAAVIKELEQQFQ